MPGPARGVKCPDLELNVLMSIEDVTVRVNAAVRPSIRREAQKARRAEINPIEKESRRRPACGATWSPLPRRAVPALPLQEVHRRAAGLGPRGGRRLLRRRPRTTSTTRATTWISASSASTKTASPPKIEHYFKWSRRGRRGRTGLRLRSSRPHRPAEYAEAPGIASRPAHPPHR